MSPKSVLGGGGRGRERGRVNGGDGSSEVLSVESGSL